MIDRARRRGVTTLHLSNGDFEGFGGDIGGRGFFIFQFLFTSDDPLYSIFVIDPVGVDIEGPSEKVFVFLRLRGCFSLSLIVCAIFRGGGDFPVFRF